MKNLLFIITCSFFFNTYSQTDFIITVNNQSQEIALDEDYEFNIDGKTIRISVKEKDTLLYNDTFYNFKYSKRHKVSKTQLDEGIEQIMLMTASGSGIIIQKYDAFDPTMLQEMMLNEVTKESVSYGYTLERKDYNKTLKSGEELKILKAELEYKGEIEVYEVSAVGRKDEGILIMTMNLGGDVDSDGENMINLLWDTMTLN
ncbi:hypothetical protein [Xanthomarina sp. F2636L]|uniref:hypothetical protein n=1 Tax=Xanthomarina sp. F2636L TaxID=2996018 RepID=UPI00225E2F27|nr:hypothetical protein [Xanthomarina sp. F2636L]MCX7551820.1 hypothetical protein [Xanthomarina sp. F2636L]